MQRLRDKLDKWTFRYFNNFSLNQVNSLATVFILTFTILFSYLLIQEEYRKFAKTLRKEQNTFLMKQYDEVIKVAWRIERLVADDSSVDPADQARQLAKLARIFSETGHRFVQVYDTQMRPVADTAQIGSDDLARLSFDGSEVAEGWVSGEHDRQKALMYSKTFGNGYRIVSGIYTLPSEAFMEGYEEEMKSRLIKIILEIVTLAFILFGFILAVSKIVNTLLARDVKGFLDFFASAAQKYQVMNPAAMFFREFRHMAGYANTMVETIAKQKGSLEQLNATLEDKVKAKTLALENKNAALEEEKAFSQELLAAQKQFVRYAIHETNTPLSVIMTNIELYTMKYGRNRYLSKIEAAMKNVFSIYDDLSFLVKKDQVDYPRRIIDFDGYLRSRLAFFDEVAQHSGVHFSYKGMDGEAKVYFNETKLQRIIDNNLTNAIKYTKQDETIRVVLAKEKDELLFSVASRSNEIKDTEKIFEAYYRERKKSNGLGLGLNLVKTICDEEGVAIAIKSSAEETRFTYRFKAHA
jgi:signal transduction histidine kinase